MGKYSKAIVAVAGVATTALQTAFPGSHWAAVAIASISALLVYIVPNQVKP